MNEFYSFVKNNSSFNDFYKCYDDNENIFYWESEISLIYQHKYYYTFISCMGKEKPKYNPFNQLVTKLIYKIYYEIGKEKIEYLFHQNYTILHRGNCKDFIENSYNALKYSLDHYDGFETDLRLSKDNKWILYHDETMERVHNLNKKINECSNEILVEKEIVFLDDLIFTNNYEKKLINLELKEKFNKVSYNDKLNLIKKIKLLKNKVIISSFDWDWYNFIKKNNLIFYHLIDDMNFLPKFFDKIIISKDQYNENKTENYVNEEKIIGIYGINKTENVKINIIDIT